MERQPAPRKEPVSPVENGYSKVGEIPKCRIIVRWNTSRIVGVAWRDEDHHTLAGACE